MILKEKNIKVIKTLGRVAPIVLFTSLIAAACGQSTTPTPLPPDIDDCQAACDHIGPKVVNYADGTIKEFPDALGCEEGEPIDMLEGGCDGGIDEKNCVSCEKFCRDTMEQRVWLEPSCVKSVMSCEKIDECRPKFEE